ncbi:AraC family transcriptional regulator [Chloroflexia bacterium SDU3-3]|nr:AraC family transcriptional regulator [Chloroflexia bacterium SDU3-3]
MSERLAATIALTERVTKADGKAKTNIPFLTVVRNTRATPPIPSVLSPSFCLILQGGKRIQFGEQIVDCPAGSFLVSVIRMPGLAQVVGASAHTPYIGLRIDLAPAEVAAVLSESGLQVRPPEGQPSIGSFVGRADDELLDLCCRLLRADASPRGAVFRASLIKQELIYHLLSGDYGHLFLQQVFFEQQGDGIAQAIVWIERHYDCAFTIEELARASNMSVSGLHHKFKALTAMGPLQYQKQLRLQEARRLMLSGAADVTAAALQVGYRSLSQFSREYARLFGMSPLRDVRTILQLAQVEALEL